MELALSIALLAGIALFVLGLLITALGGFKHHFFTGILALIPFINFIILPTVWHRVKIGFYMGVVGFLLAIGSWYAGGNQYLAQEAQKLGMNLPNEETPAVTGEESNDEDGNDNSQNMSQSNNVAPPKKEKPAYIPTGDLLTLPKDAIYKMGFKTVASNNTSGLTGKYVRIKQKKGGITEGRVSQSDASSIFIEHYKDSTTVAFEIKTDSIDTLEKLVKFNK